MKRSTIILLAVIGVIVLWAISFQRGMVGMNEGVAAQWSNVENAYQLRADKTKNIVQIIKGSADFEQKTLTDVIEARAKATSIQLNADDLTPEKIAQFEAGPGPAQRRAQPIDGDRGTLPRPEDHHRPSAISKPSTKAWRTASAWSAASSTTWPAPTTTKIKADPQQHARRLSSALPRRATSSPQEGTDVAPDIDFSK
jgi:hypothetical protein